PDKQISMSRIVYDHDYPADDLKGVLPLRWSGDGWKEDNPGRHNNGFKRDASADLDWLRYQHILRPPPGCDNSDNRKWDNKPELITDFMGYNTYESMDPYATSVSSGRVISNPIAVNWVGDLMLECEVKVDQANDGELILELSRSADIFQARFNLKDHTLALFRNDSDKPLENPVPVTLEPGKTYTLRFANYDDRLTV